MGTGSNINVLIFNIYVSEELSKCWVSEIRKKTLTSDMGKYKTYKYLSIISQVEPGLKYKA